ncbi:hypothetical protein KAFR_0B06630 [Kazachstania africana CBS 2517]|uniref:CCAAT-binding factor domain-containing protein n=1 Tax=Kazachstania africana (strain ATCC 22294 / BCRC 22015 / CBS 2517 / CECT 1963 / NBRC 1671 / NRRL Y-8276) TaxID=1071382 RepID=H2ARG0_KAZAF|nr:hypothetical protein KAFR_0B06630 [Kazachstania africana CBS 2517]CCF56960.1 hypothetical protein KAFR_0B06630 [Kazachstania africana CBS 2517]
MSLSMEEIKTAAKKITTSGEKTHYNSIITLMNVLNEISIENQSRFQEDDTYEAKFRFLIVSLFQIFKKLFDRGDLTNQKSPSPEILKFNQWCKKIYENFKTKLAYIISELTIETSLSLDAQDLYLQLLELESTYFASQKDAPFFPNKTLRKLIVALWNSDVPNSINNNGESNNYILVEFLKKYYKAYADIQYYFQLELGELLSENDYYKSQKSISKWLTIANHDTHCSLDTADFEVFVANPPQAIENISKFKSTMEKNWLAVLNGDLSISQYKTILLVLHKRIIPHFHTPTKLMDFLTDSYDLQSIENSEVIPLLALNGLFELMRKFNLEYPNFFLKLYKLINNDLMHVKYRARFFRLMDLFLSSTHLSINLVASFIKKLARLSLTAPPGAIVSIIPFIYNLLKKHPNCMIMIHNPKFINDPFRTDSQELTKLKQEYTDPFNMDEENPEITNAINSSLWELEALMDHYHPNVSTLAKIFGQPFRKLNYNMEDFLDWSYDSLLTAEQTRKLKVLPSLEYEKWDLALVNGINSGEHGKDNKSVFLDNIAW